MLKVVKNDRETSVLSTYDLLQFLHSLDARIEDGILYLNTLKIRVNDRISIQTLEEIVIQSGRTKNNAGFVNAVHINPTLDNNNNPIRPFIPFSQLKTRIPPKRPIKNHNKNCRCCHG